MCGIGVMAVVAAAMAAAGLVLLAQGLARRTQGRAPAGEQVDADLEKQLERARSIPGAEPMLDRLSRQPVIFARELADFAAQLDNLERKAKVEEARKHAASERRAPLVARIVREAIADMAAARQARQAGGD